MASQSISASPPPTYRSQGSGEEWSREGLRPAQAAGPASPTYRSDSDMSSQLSGQRLPSIAGEDEPAWDSRRRWEPARDRQARPKPAERAARPARQSRPPRASGLAGELVPLAEPPERPRQATLPAYPGSGTRAQSYEVEAGAQSEGKPAKSSRKCRNALIAAAVLAAIGGIAAGVYIGVHHKSSSSQDTAAQTTYGYTSTTSPAYRPTTSSASRTTSAPRSSVASNTASRTANAATSLAATSNGPASSAAASATPGSFGSLAYGNYAVALTKTSDNCGGFPFARPSAYHDTWSFASDGGNLALLTFDNGAGSAELRQPTASGPVSVSLPTIVNSNLIDGCNFLQSFNFQLTLTAGSFSGQGTYTYNSGDINCVDFTNNQVFFPGTTCECVYTTAGTAA